MNRQIAARRRVKKRKTPGQNSRVKFSMFLGIMILAVFLGYLTARFVVGPMIGYDADESPARIAGEADGETQKDKTKTDGETEEASENAKASEDTEAAEKTASDSAVPTEGFALQFGAFSTREAAEKLSDSLKSQGIDTKIVEVDDVFKVISPVVETKDKALDQLEDLSEKEVEDVFVTFFG